MNSHFHKPVDTISPKVPLKTLLKLYRDRQTKNRDTWPVYFAILNKIPNGANVFDYIPKDCDTPSHSFPDGFDKPCTCGAFSKAIDLPGLSS